jgi:hypothetical protein
MVVTVILKKRSLPESIFLPFQMQNQQTNSTDEKHGLNFANEKRSSQQIVRKYACCILRKTRTNKGIRQFLQQIECKESFRVRLKKDALPTLSKPLALLGSSLDMKARSYSQRRQQKKVIILSSKSVSMHRLYSLFVSKTYL